MNLWGNAALRIREAERMNWDCADVSVAPRSYHALCFRIRGSAVFTHEEQSVASFAGDVAYIPAGCGYRALYREANEIYVIHFESDMMADMHGFPADEYGSMLSYFEEAYRLWQEKEDGYYYRVMAILCEILGKLSAGGAAPTLRTAGDFGAAVDYLNGNFTDSDLTIEKVVSRSHVSGTCFRRLFHERFAASPGKYLTALRLGHAEKLLSTGKYTVSEVAARSGFRDEKYFSRVFKKEFGFPPSKSYRWGR